MSGKYMGGNRYNAYRMHRDDMGISRKIQGLKYKLSTKDKINKVFERMKSVCGDPKNSNYDRFGGKGIQVKMTLEDVAALWEKHKASDMEHPAIKRIDIDGHYEPSNCLFWDQVNMRELRKVNTEYKRKMLDPDS